MKGLLVFSCFILFGLAVKTQPVQIEGRVISLEDNKPLEGASVFINNGSGGTLTNRKGHFSISTGSQSVFELVISFVSYETIVIKISPENIRKLFLVKMSPKSSELKEVIVGAIEKDGWKRWGPTFIQNFIGTSENASACEIKNPQVLRFRVDRKSGVLTVYASDKLVIINRALGYQINYQLEEFSVDRTKGVMMYTGYSYFDTIATNRTRQLEKWKNNRKAAFAGSLTHFMRAFYRGQTEEEGFEIRQLIRLYKRDSSTRKLYERLMQNDLSVVDTSRFYIRFIKESTLSAAVIYITARQPLALDSIRRFDSASGECSLSFSTDIQVVFLDELESTEFIRQQSISRSKQLQTSIVFLVNKRPVYVQENGLYFQPLDLFTEGYWAFEKAAEMLPSDYRVGE